MMLIFFPHIMTENITAEFLTVKIHRKKNALAMYMMQVHVTFQTFIFKAANRALLGLKILEKVQIG